MKAHILALVLALPVAHAASAQRDDPLTPFERCGTIGDETPRLACFDAALAQARSASQQRQERRVRRATEDFGLSAPQVAEQARAEPNAIAGDDAEPSAIDSVLQEVFADGNGRRVFLLANGQVWRETTGSSYSGILRDGWKTSVRKGGIGGYRLSFDGRTGFFKVLRVR